MPTFKVVLDKCNEPIVKGDTMLVQGRAISYTGVPVVHAKVRISISNSYWNKTAFNEIFVTQTDDNGRFFLPYKTKEEQNTYYIQTDVTDINGETHSSQKSEYLTDKPFILDVFHRLYPETEIADSVLSIIRISRQYNSPNLRNIKYSKLQLNLIHWTNLLEPAQKEYGELLVTNAFTGEKGGCGNVRQEQPSSSAATIRVRKNFQETAFFYPELYTDADGRIRFDFTLPDQLTTCKLYAAAHTSDLHSGWFTTSLQTRQTLMVQSNAPRFLREGDTSTFQIK